MMPAGMDFSRDSRARASATTAALAEVWALKPSEPFTDAVSLSRPDASIVPLAAYTVLRKVTDPLSDWESDVQETGPVVVVPRV